MFVPDTLGLAMLMMVTSAVCWGSWANSYKATKGYRFELFYWDYAVGIFLVSLLYAFTLGSTGGRGEGFLANVRAADAGNVVSAMIGGFIFNVANLLLVAAIDLAGLAVAFPVAIVAVILDCKAYGRLAKGGQAVSRKSIVVCIVSGVLMGSFAPFVTRALTRGHPLTPYSIAVFFTLAAFVCCFVVNVYFMKKPLVGTPVDFSGFFAARPQDHALGVLGGAIWGTGTVFNFVAASFTGVAISYAIGQSAPMVAAVWGVFVWREFAGADAKAKTYLGLMFLFYILALVAIASAYQAA